MVFLAIFPLEFRCKRQQGDVARPLDRLAKPPLVARAGAGHTAWQDFAAVLDKLVEHFGLLVVNEIHFVHAKAAHLALAEKLALPLAATRSSGATAWCASASVISRRTPSSIASVTSIASTTGAR